jgi:hypothetical protein
MPRALLALAISAAACSSAQPAESTLEGVEQPASAPVLAIEALRVVGTEGVAIELRSDGTVIAGGQEAAQLGPDGRLVTGDEVVAAIEADGKLIGHDRVIGNVAEDGSATLAGGETLGFDASGKVEWNREGVELRLDPADSPAKRAAMMLIIVLMI